jgi:hypothetical protein
VRDLAGTAGRRVSEQTTVMMGKWAATLYGFVEGDTIYDTTRSFGGENAGNALVARAEALAGQNPRFTLSARGSRFGFRIKAPEVAGVRVSGVIEADFLGSQSIGTGTGQVSEGNFFTAPLLRMRHFNFKIETPVVDFLVGQTWQLFGWQNLYNPNTVEIQGVPGELNARTPQVRVSKTIKLYPLTLEIAAAASRPVQRDAGTPDGQGGVRLALDVWTGVQTLGATGTQISPASVAATTLLRHVAIDEWSASPKVTKDFGVSAFALDGFFPLVPGTQENKDNSFSLNGEFATGYGFADMYSGLSGGLSFPALLTPTGAMTAPVYTPNIDAGIVTYDTKGNPHGIQWTTYLVGAQYYFPYTSGRLWISGNYSHLSSDNAHLYGAKAKTLSEEDWFDVNVFGDPLPAVRLGIEYANFNDLYVDGNHSINHRFQFSGFFTF